MKIRQQENRRETDVRRADDILTDNILTDDILRDALSDANLIRYAGAVSEETEPVYSERYRKKIAALLNRRDIQRYASRKSTAAFRRTVTGAACVLMTFFIAGAGVLLINPSAQAAVSRFLTELNENFATYHLAQDYPEDFTPGQEEFQLFCESKADALRLPEGYEKVASYLENDGSHFLSWYRNGEGDQILLMCSIMRANSYTLIPYDDTVPGPQHVTHDGISVDLYLSESQGAINRAVWNDNGTNVMYTLDGKLSQNELLEMVASIS